MKIGIPKEIKNNENRGLSPSGTCTCDQGHEVLVETNAGLDLTLKMVIIKAGAKIVDEQSKSLGC